MRNRFDELVAPFNEGRPRTKKDLVRALLDITSERTLFHFAGSLSQHEIPDNYNVLRHIARCLSDTGDLHKLRLLSKRIARTASSVGALKGVYKRLYVAPAYCNPKLKRDKHALSRVGFGCNELVVTFREHWGNHEFPPSVIFNGSTAQVNDWRHVFEFCPNLTTLTIVTEQCPTGMLWNRTSTALTSLRTAFEEAGLKQVRKLRMSPVDMIYIGQFKWNGPAFGDTSPAAMDTWSRIAELELQILPLPEFHNKLDRVQAMKLFNTWLRALAPRLLSLKLCYLGGEVGEHPFALMASLDVKLRAQPNMRMPVLEEMWLARVKNVEGSDDLLDYLAPDLKKYRVLVHSAYALEPLRFGPNGSEEIWRTVYLKQDALSQPSHSRHQSKHSTPGRPSYEVISSTPMRSAQRSVTAPSPQTFVPTSTRPSTSTSRTATSTFPTLAEYESYNSTGTTAVSSPREEYGRLRQTSLPVQPKVQRKRGSSGFSSIFKFNKSRPKSEPTKKKLEIKLIGETPQDQVPAEFRGNGTHHVTLAESLARYRTDAVDDLGLPPALKLAPQQQVGHFNYAPGTLFQAGSGARLPTTPKLDSRERSDSRRSSGQQQPTPDQIRSAFAKMGLLHSSSNEPVAGDRDLPPALDHAQSRRNRSGRRNQEHTYDLSRYQSRGDEFASFSGEPGSVPSSDPSWETIDRGGGGTWGTPSSRGAHAWGGRRSSEERYELPAGNSGRNSKRNSKRMSQLEDVVEEGDGNAKRGFAGTSMRY